jgi:hypothetical protein
LLSPHEIPIIIKNKMAITDDSDDGVGVTPR